MMVDISQCKNALGSFGDDAKARIEAFINNPCVDTWDNIYSIVIGGQRFTTIWQAVCDLDSSYNNIGKVTDVKGRVLEDWKRIPSAELVIRAIRIGSR